jgi:hypothetical protein
MSVRSTRIDLNKTFAIVQLLGGFFVMTIILSSC